MARHAPTLSRVGNAHAHGNEYEDVHEEEDVHDWLRPLLLADNRDQRQTGTPPSPCGY